MPAPLALVAAKIALPYAAKLALNVWITAQSSSLFAFLAAHGLAVSAGAQTLVIAAAAAGKYEQMKGNDEQAQIDAMVKTVGTRVSRDTLRKIVEFLN